jgi:hypothetical protein
MSIERLRAGVYVELMAKAKERVLPKSGRVCVPYVGEWGAPDRVVEVRGYDERIAETFGRVDTVELAAEGGATLVLYRMTDGSAQAASYSQADCFELTAKYPGLEGNQFVITIRDSMTEPGKKEVLIKHRGLGLGHRLTVTNVDDLVAKTANLPFVNQAKKLGDAPLTDVVEAAFSGGTSGTPASLTGADFTALFAGISGADFDALYLPSADPAIMASAKQFIADRRTFNQKLSTLVVGGTSATDGSMDAHIARSTAMNERFVINSAIAGEHVNGKTYSSLEWAAWTAGLVASTPAHISLTAQPVPLKKAVKDWGHTEILKGLANGVWMATRDGSQYVVESAINTLSTLHAGEREDFAKVRVSMTLDQIMNDLIAVGKKYKGKLNNNEMGRTTFIAAAKSYLDERIRQAAIEQGATIAENPDKASVGDVAYFVLKAQPLDAIEVFDIKWEVL